MTAVERAACVACAVAALVLSPKTARASDAETLFREGRALLDAKKYDEACPKLAESQRLDPGAGTLLALALCHEGQGKTATAHTELEQASEMGRKVGRTDLATAAQKRARAMDGALARVTIRMPAAETEGYDVRCDGEHLGPERLGVPFAIDPGEHRVEVSATNKLPRSYVVRIAGSSAVEIVVENLQDAPAPVAVAVARSAPVLATQPAPPAADEHRGGGQRTLGVLTMVAGGGAVVAGGIFGVKAATEKSAADRVCSTRPCNEQAMLDGRESSKHSMNAAILSAAAGTGALAVGAIVYFTAPSAHTTGAASPPRKTTARLVPETSPTQVGLGLHGTF